MEENKIAQLRVEGKRLGARAALLGIVLFSLLGFTALSACTHTSAQTALATSKPPSMSLGESPKTSLSPAQQQFILTQTPTSSSTLKPLATTTLTPSITPTASITPTPISTSICTTATNTTEPDGWDCLNESYGFSVHFPSTAEIARTTENIVDVWLQNSPSNPRITRMLEIALGKSAESCISSDAETKQIGNHEFIINRGFEPSGVVYAWKSYAVTKETKSVCFIFVVGFESWEQNDPPFPLEKDHWVDEVESILATFQWLNR